MYPVIRQIHSAPVKIFESDDLKEADRLFEWALSYERRGLTIAAEALRDEGRKAFENFLALQAKLPRNQSALVRQLTEF